jgi:hypothetical protein
MAKYGLTRQASHVFNGMFEAAMYFDLHRMPELFCGLSKETGEGPVLYPVACAPQAASMFMLFQACLGIQVDGIRNQVKFVRPTLPDFLDEIRIVNLRVGDSALDLDLVRQSDGVGLTVKNARNGRPSRCAYELRRPNSARLLTFTSELCGLTQDVVGRLAGRPCIPYKSETATPNNGPLSTVKIDVGWPVNRNESLIQR